MEKDIDAILLKEFSNIVLTDEENILLESWKKDSQENLKVYAELKKYWDHKNYTNHDIKERVLGKVKRSIADYNNNPRSIQEKTNDSTSNRNYLLVAASVLLLLGTFFIIDFQQINYNKTHTSSDEVISMFTRENKRGERRTFKLSDGTIIKLNTESKISFPEKFNEKTREVFLEGEAFFDVKKDASRPFIIHSSSVTTKVLGTSFNIKAYADGEDIIVSVVTGLVEVKNEIDEKNIQLKPREKAVYNNETKGLKKNEFDLTEISWRDGKLIFEKADLKEVIKELERWYGVDFIIGDQVIFNKGLYSESFSEESLETVLETISFAGGFQFKINNNKVEIY